MSQQSLSILTTGLIAASGVSLLIGWYFIRWRRDRRTHQRWMLTASACAGLFLIGYLTRWYLHGSKPFEGPGWWRGLYLSVLIPHVLLAMALGPLVIYLIWLALRKQDFRRHRKLAIVVLPIWLFVAASGWVLYLLLYRVF